METSFIYEVDSSHHIGLGIPKYRQKCMINLTVLDHPFGVNISSIDESFYVTDFKRGELRKYAMDGWGSNDGVIHQDPVWKLLAYFSFYWNVLQKTQKKMKKRKEKATTLIYCISDEKYYLEDLMKSWKNYRIYSFTTALHTNRLVAHDLV